MIVKILISFFILFALSRAYLRYRDGEVKITGLVIWVFVWSAILFFAWWPAFSDLLANSIGVGRGVDALIYVSIVALFYGMFRLYVKLEFIEHEITSIVRNLALKEKLDKNHEPTHTDSTGK